MHANKNDLLLNNLDKGFNKAKGGQKKKKQGK